MIVGGVGDLRLTLKAAGESSRLRRRHDWKPRPSAEPLAVCKIISDFESLAGQGFDSDSQKNPSAIHPQQDQPEAEENRGSLQDGAKVVPRPSKMCWPRCVLMLSRINPPVSCHRQ